MPNPESVWAKEGTAAHMLAEQCLATNKQAAELIGTEVYGVEVTEEMADAVQVYLNWVRELAANASSDSQEMVEFRFDVSQKLGVEGVYGTADHVLYDPEIRTLWVTDYKHGSGLAVEVAHNKQLKYYALGALLSLNVPVVTVWMTIVQPRCFHPGGAIRSFSIDAVDLLEFEADLVDAIAETKKTDAALSAGPHCKFCPAHAVCPEFNTKALAVARAEFAPEKYDPKELAKTLKWLPVLKDFIKNVEAFAYREGMHGRIPPGFKLVNKRAMRKWKMPDLSAVAQALGVDADELYEKKPLTPAQVEKKFKGKKDEVFEFVEKTSTGLTLVPESDKRPAVSTNASDEFIREDLLS
jgi:hypothetical protein